MIYDIIIVKEGAFMSNRFHIVKKYIDQMDYYGLLAGGAPFLRFYPCLRTLLPVFRRKEPTFV